ncbi:MAG TPA: Stp1/IreP family PP2C-type Ser/Thr phosphatase [Elusimicrobiota bacterium]|nr:Stp1/IreP family PP2C-type Ser/Thr phosphatase [Elusimicrobiota bacterium]
MKFVAAGLTDPGQVRKNNEDNYWVDPDLGLLIVADGMGGHASGEVASQMAVDLVKAQVANGLKTGKIPAMGEKPLHLSMRAHLLAVSLRMANEVVYEASQSRAENKGMGTTIVAVLADRKSFAVAHVGDSRLYLHRGGKLRQLTRDHSVVAEQVAKGLLTPEQAEQSEIKNVLTRALGVGPEVEVDVDEQSLRADDVLLLCTDGLPRMADDAVIQDVLAHSTDPLEICNALIKIANERGGKDNVTVAVARAFASGILEKIVGRFKRA